MGQLKIQPLRKYIFWIFSLHSLGLERVRLLQKLVICLSKLSNSYFITWKHHLKYLTITTASSSWTWKCLLCKWWGCHFSSWNGWRTTSSSSSQSLVIGAQEKSPILLQTTYEQERQVSMPVKSTLESPLAKLDKVQRSGAVPQQQFQKMRWQAAQLPSRLCAGKLLWGLKLVCLFHYSRFPHFPRALWEEQSTLAMCEYAVEY